MDKSPKQIAAEALLIWRWSHHKLLSQEGGKSRTTAEDHASFHAAMRAVEVAKEFGVLDEFMKVLNEHPILEVTVTEMKEERRAATRKYKTPRRY